MNFPLFCAFTVLGAAIWVAILASSGYWIGQNQEAVLSHLQLVNITLIIVREPGHRIRVEVQQPRTNQRAD